MNTRMKGKYAALPLAALLLATVDAGPATADTDIGRQLTGHYCTNPMAMPKAGACIALTDGQQTAQGYFGSPNRTLAIRPGVYWLTVSDNAAVHNFSLQAPDGSDADITGVTETPGAVTIKVNLTPGEWVLFCEPHRGMGMYVDIEVGGVGQVG